MIALGQTMTECHDQQAGCLLEILLLTSSQIEDGAFIPAEQVFAAIEAANAAERDVVEAVYR